MAFQKVTSDEKIRGLLFDLDGTLVDSYRPIMESLNYVRASFNFPPYAVTEVKKMVGRGLEVLIGEAIGRKHIKDGVSMFRAKYKEIFIEKTSLLPDVNRTIRELFKRGYIMGVASNKPSYFTSEILKSQKMYDYFKVVLGPDHVIKPKPDPEMIDLSLAKMEIAKNEVLYIGDMVLDVEAGRRAGVKVCVIPAGSSSQQELEETDPDCLLNNFKELTSLLPPLNG